MSKKLSEHSFYHPYPSSLPYTIGDIGRQMSPVEHSGEIAVQAILNDAEVRSAYLATLYNLPYAAFVGMFVENPELKSTLDLITSDRLNFDEVSRVPGLQKFAINQYEYIFQLFRAEDELNPDMRVELAQLKDRFATILLELLKNAEILYAANIIQSLVLYADPVNLTDLEQKIGRILHSKLELAGAGYNIQLVEEVIALMHVETSAMANKAAALALELRQLKISQ